MTRKEFDQKVTEMKMQRNEALKELRKLHSAVKEEITLKARESQKLNAEIASLKQQRIIFARSIEKIGGEWTEKIREFIRENEPSTTSNLAEADTLNIIYELRRRGYTGMVEKEGAKFDIAKEWTEQNEQVS